MDEKFGLQLYYVIATGFGTIQNLHGQHILEIGSGRGGGLKFLKQTLNPETALGIDICLQHTKLATGEEGCEFITGNAEFLIEIFPESKDMVISIETSHCVGDM